MHLAVDFHVNFVAVPSPVCVTPHAINVLTPDFRGERGPNRFHLSRMVPWRVSYHARPAGAKYCHTAINAIHTTARRVIPIGIEPDSRKVKTSSSFLRKRTKKLLLIGVRVGSNGRLKLQKFLLLFSKRSAFLLAKGQPQRRLMLDDLWRDVEVAKGVLYQPKVAGGHVKGNLV